jgi:hypothetical protein
MPPSKQDVERVIAAVPGVVSASVGSGSGGGRGRLRIRLEDGADAKSVSESVAEALHSSFGITVDPASLVPPAQEPVTAGVGAHTAEGSVSAPPPAPVGADPLSSGPHDSGEVSDDDVRRALRQFGEPLVEPAASEAEVQEQAADSGAAAESETDVSPDPVVFSQEVTGGWVNEDSTSRPRIEQVDVRRDDLEVHVEVTLSSDGDRVVRSAVGANTRKGTLRAAVRAALDAAEELVDHRMKGELESIDLVHDGEDDRCTVTVSLLTVLGEEKLVGVSLTRGEPVQGTVRATLDAINRRVQLLRSERA